MPQRRFMRSKHARMIISALVVTGVIGVSGCTLQKVESGSTSNRAKTSEMKEDAKPVASVSDGDTNVSVIDPVTVKAGSKLSNVSLTSSDGTEVKGQSENDGKSWKTDEDLGYGKTYTLTATAKDKKLNSTFTTVSPTYPMSPTVTPGDGMKVGVGQPLSIDFGDYVTNKKKIEDNVEVTTEPHVDGSFYWVNERLLRWRPKDYWQPGTKVTVKTKLYGKDLGEGSYVNDDVSSSVTIGDQIIATADDNTKEMVVKKNGEVVKTMPISMGSASYPTPNGVYFLGDHNPSMIMDSSTFGLPTTAAGGYRSTVNYATQMSFSGIYVHSAPWSIAQQGNTNVSHGCLNVSPDNAKWFLENTTIGDIVEVKNTQGGQLSGTDGLGDWNIPYDKIVESGKNGTVVQ